MNILTYIKPKNIKKENRFFDSLAFLEVILVCWNSRHIHHHSQMDGFQRVHHIVFGY
jgi:hypothetical protein